MGTCVDTPLKLITPDYDSHLTDVIIELDRLRNIRLGGTTPAMIFFQIKDIFHFLESLASARIEGNRTTIAEYVDTKIDSKSKKTDTIWEMENIEKAMHFVEETIEKNGQITHQIIRDIHRIVVEGLKREGDQTPGAYRKNKNVKIANADHLPPEWTAVQGYMDELIDFLNEESRPRHDLLKVAIAHHRFTWIHPFGNGNGRVVRVLTYLLLIKYGFKPQTGGRILNPTAVFCNSREQYYEMLAKADSGTDQGILEWCTYMLSGISEELSRVDKLTDYSYLKEKILLPALNFSSDRKIITDMEKKILKIAIEKEEFKAKDIENIISSPRQRTHQIKKLLEANMIAPIEGNSRIYMIYFTTSQLIRGVMDSLKNEGFTSSLDD